MQWIMFVLCLLPGSAAAQSRSVEVRVTDGGQAWVHSMRVTEGNQANFVGAVRGTRGGTRQMILNILLGADPGRPGEYGLQYQFELSERRAGEVRTVQAQGEVLMRRGSAAVVLECGGHSVRLALDPARSDKPAAVPPGNYRASAELASGRGKVRCAQVNKLGVQGNAVEGGERSGRRYGLILNSLLTHAERELELQYQLQYTPTTAPVGTVQVQSTERLAPGKRSESRVSGYRLALTAAPIPQPLGQAAR